MLRKFKNIRQAALAVAAAIGVATAAYTSSANAADIDFGEIGEPIDLVVGYQPYYTEAWSGVVMKGKKFYEKYLPEGSTVTFEIGLQGGIIVNAMLAGKQHIGYMGDMPAIVATLPKTEWPTCESWQPQALHTISATICWLEMMPPNLTMPMMLSSGWTEK